MKKLSISLILVVMILSACGPTTWVLEKERLGEGGRGEMQVYVEEMQENDIEFRGYNVFTIAEGKKMVVVSTGSSDTSLNFVEAVYPDENTTITVEEVPNTSNEENAYILIGIGEIKGELTVLEQNGEEFSMK